MGERVASREPSDACNRENPKPADEGSCCPRCGTRFRCGVNDEACWCTTLPHLDPHALAALDDSVRGALGLRCGPLPAACLCRACLAAMGAALDARAASNDNADRAGPTAAIVPRTQETPEP